MKTRLRRDWFGRRRRAQDRRIVQWVRTHQLVALDDDGRPIVAMPLEAVYLAMRWACPEGELIPGRLYVRPDDGGRP